jgi:hypothetical protein
VREFVMELEMTEDEPAAVARERIVTAQRS